MSGAVDRDNRRVNLVPVCVPTPQNWLEKIVPVSVHYGPSNTGTLLPGNEITGVIRYRVRVREVAFVASLYFG